MFRHEAVMLFPVEVSGSDPNAAAMLHEQFGGANGELTALLQYLVQSFGTSDPFTRQLLLNIAVEEASHLEMVGTAITQLMTMGASSRSSGLNYEPATAITGEALRQAPSLVHKMVNVCGAGPMVSDSLGVPFTGAFISATGDTVTNLASDVAAELRAGQVYRQLRNNIQDAGLNRTLEFLEEREATHGAMFAEALERVKDQGIVKQQGYTKVAQRIPNLSEPFELLVSQMSRKFSGEPIKSAILPSQVAVELAESGQHLVPLA